jgi:hypothetical protein
MRLRKPTVKARRRLFIFFWREPWLSVLYSFGPANLRVSYFGYPDKESFKADCGRRGF